MENSKVECILMDMSGWMWMNTGKLSWGVGWDTSNASIARTIMHDESTFFQNDECNMGWSHANSKPKLKAKGSGQSLIVLDFLTSDWGWLHNGDK